MVRSDHVLRTFAYTEEMRSAGSRPCALINVTNALWPECDERDYLNHLPKVVWAIRSLINFELFACSHGVCLWVIPKKQFFSLYSSEFYRSYQRLALATSTRDCPAVHRRYTTWLCTCGQQRPLELQGAASEVKEPSWLHSDIKLCEKIDFIQCEYLKK